MSDRERQSSKAAPRHGITSYWERTQWPLQSLCFLLPLLIIYEVGTLIFASTAGALPMIRAESLLYTAFGALGVTSFYLPPLIVVIVLLVWHLARRDPWGLEPGLYVLMAVESILLALPLLVFSAVLFREPVMQAGLNELPGPWAAKLLLSIGAGLYEELVFRLILIALLHLFLVDLLALPAHWGAALAVLLSAAAFGLYHFEEINVLNWTSQEWRRMVFYMGAGVYFAAVYVLRGFGIVAACHAIYDIVVVTAPYLQSR